MTGSSPRDERDIVERGRQIAKDMAHVYGGELQRVMEELCDEADRRLAYAHRLYDEKHERLRRETPTEALDGASIAQGLYDRGFIAKGAVQDIASIISHRARLSTEREPQPEAFRVDRQTGSWLGTAIGRAGFGMVSVDDAMDILHRANRVAREQPAWGLPGEPGGLSAAPISEEAETGIGPVDTHIEGYGTIRSNDTEGGDPTASTGRATVRGAGEVEEPKDAAVGESGDEPLPYGDVTGSFGTSGSPAPSQDTVPVSFLITAHVPKHGGEDEAGHAFAAVLAAVEAEFKAAGATETSIWPVPDEWVVE